jgi:hypothetical protein
MGIEHILTGYDHLLFLVCLVIPFVRLRGLLPVITAFTVAHSITLALAAFSIVTPPARLVEALIAASIVYVGLENVWALRRHAEARAIAHRWLLTFAFGLVHGFGFAAALRELHLPRALLATGLVGFNLGVEAGQLCIVALLLLLLRRLSLGPRVTRALSLAVSALGVVWLVQRVV